MTESAEGPRDVQRLLEASVLEAAADALPWEYKAEGNANVTLRYVPERDTACSKGAFTGHVLRLRKSSSRAHAHALPPAPAAAPATGTTAGEDLLLLPPDSLDFATKVMVPLLGGEYVIPGVRVPLSAAALRVLSSHVSSWPTRPAKRRHDALDVAAGECVVMLDHSMLSPAAGDSASTCTNFCVEIKPKCGAPPPVASATLCRYCAHQLLKAAEAVGFPDGCKADGSTPSVSELLALDAAAVVSCYCPLDLFCRDDPARMRVALNGLVRAPQNNFRVFRNGIIVFEGEKQKHKRATAGTGPPQEAQRLDAVLRDAPEFADLPRESATASPAATALLDIVLAVLQRDDVLSRLKVVQAGGDAVSGVDGALRVYERLQQQRATGDEVAALRQFLIAQSAKDCSLLISFQVQSMQTVGAQGGGHETAAAAASAPASSPAAAAAAVSCLGDQHASRKYGELVCSLSGTTATVHVCYSIAVVDLDAKPAARIPAYAAVEHRLAEVTTAWLPALFDAASKRCAMQAGAR